MLTDKGYMGVCGPETAVRLGIKSWFADIRPLHDWLHLWACGFLFNKSVGTSFIIIFGLLSSVPETASEP